MGSCRYYFNVNGRSCNVSVCPYVMGMAWLLHILRAWLLVLSSSLQCMQRFVIQIGVRNNQIFEKMMANKKIKCSSVRYRYLIPESKV